MLADRELNIHDYLAIARRRVWWLVLPAVIVPVLTFLVSLKIPNRYTSETTVLVDQQKVPDNFVKPVVTEDLNGRLATMQEQILSRTRLQPMIERFGLFKADQGKVPMEVLVDRMRKLITVTPLRANEGVRRGDMPGFSISFTAENARLAQQICAEITSMFMSENLKAREQSAMGTTDFLISQLDEAKHELDSQDSKLAQFKMKYTGQLPEQEQTNLSMLATLNSQLDATTQMLARAQQDKTYSESLLAQQTAAWQASSRTTANPDTLEHQLSALQSQLVTLQSKYTDDHPDIIKLKREIARLKKALSENASASDALSKDAYKVGLTQPPELQQLRLQIHQLESVVKERSSEQQRLRQQIGLYQSRVQLSPKVEEEYKQLTRDYTTAQKFYDDLLNKKTQSEMATNLERRQQGEQFRVMDPPNLPETPTYPKRWQFAGFGVLGGLGIGLAAVVILEFRDKVVRTESDVEYYLKLPTLAMVPLVGAAAAHRAPKGKPRSSRSPSSARQVIGA
ncbi:MAG: Wzz/FepE/Etk N-terminal domain-containing protein [Terriglobales bacterium]